MSVRHRVFIVAVALVGCSSETPPDSGGTPPDSGGSASTPVDQLAGENIRLQCDWLFRCCDTTKLFRDAPTATRADCDARIAGDVNKGVAELRALMTAGKITYDGVSARRCIDTLSARSCGSWTADAACSAIWKGTLADGKACDRAVECVSGVCQRTCLKVPVVGEACGDFPCAAGAYCDRTTLQCAAKKPNGAACNDAEECTGDYCRASIVCETRKPDGEPCSGPDECKSGHCDAGTRTCALFLEAWCYQR